MGVVRSWLALDPLLNEGSPDRPHGMSPKETGCDSLQEVRLLCGKMLKVAEEKARQRRGLPPLRGAVPWLPSEQLQKPAAGSDEGSSRQDARHPEGGWWGCSWGMSPLVQWAVGS